MESSHKGIIKNSHKRRDEKHTENSKRGREKRGGRTMTSFPVKVKTDYRVFFERGRLGFSFIQRT